MFVGPLVQHTDGAPDGTSYHVGKFLGAVGTGGRPFCGTYHIAVEHGYGFLKKFVASGTFKEVGEKRIVHSVVTDGQEIGVTHLMIVLRVEGFH